jgi:hypothetical protein
VKTLLLALGLVLGCNATRFNGSPNISLEQCTAKCQIQHMQVSGMVFLGEYSSACVCQASPAASPPAAASAGALPAAVGVILQQQADQQQASTMAP